MITLQESHFFLIIILVSLITYILFSVFQSCDIHCKVNYYKYENHHTMASELKSKSSSKKEQLPDINKVLFNAPQTNNTTFIGDKTSSHSSGIQGSDINISEEDEYIRKLFSINT